MADDVITQDQVSTDTPVDPDTTVDTAVETPTDSTETPAGDVLDTPITPIEEPYVPVDDPTLTPEQRQINEITVQDDCRYYREQTIAKDGKPSYLIEQGYISEKLNKKVRLIHNLSPRYNDAGEDMGMACDSITTVVEDLVVSAPTELVTDTIPTEEPVTDTPEA